MPEYEINPADGDSIDTAIGAAWHEFRYPRPATDEPDPAFKRAIRVAIETYRAADGPCYSKDR